MPSLWKKFRERRQGKKSKKPPADDIHSTTVVEASPETNKEPETLAWFKTLYQDASNGDRLDVFHTPFFLEQWATGNHTVHSDEILEWTEKTLLLTLPSQTESFLRHQLASTYLATGFPDRGLTHWQSLIHSEFAETAHFELGEHFRRNSRPEEARSHYQRVMAINVRNESARAHLERLNAKRPIQSGEDRTLANASGIEAGRYTVIRELGRGTSSVVYLAKESPIDRAVALKILHPHLHQTEEARRFLEEAKMVASLRHPNLIRLWDIDPISHRLTMEFAGGGTARSRLHNKGPFPLPLAINIYHQVLLALQATHSQRIIHRDIKPENIFFRRPLTKQAETMLGDFGVAHLGDKETFGGTIAYMPPEQRENQTPAPSMDIFSAAVVLIELLTGALPWNQKELLNARDLRTFVHFPSEPKIESHVKECLGPARLRPTLNTCLEWAHTFSAA